MKNKTLFILALTISIILIILLFYSILNVEQPKEMSPTECIDRGGRNQNIVAGDFCYENETNIGEVVGFISPNVCCMLNNYCPEDRGDYCIQVYEPACGFGNFGNKTYSNGCVACLDTSVEYYIEGECP